MECDPTAEVLDPYDLCSTPEHIEEEDKIRYIFETNVKRAVESDIVVAYIPSASMGTAVEINQAWMAKKTVYTISPLSTNWVIRLYSTKVFPTLDDFKHFFRTQYSAAIPRVQENPH